MPPRRPEMSGPDPADRPLPAEAPPGSKVIANFEDYEANTSDVPATFEKDVDKGAARENLAHDAAETQVRPELEEAQSKLDKYEGLEKSDPLIDRSDVIEEARNAVKSAHEKFESTKAETLKGIEATSKEAGRKQIELIDQLDALKPGHEAVITFDALSGEAGQEVSLKLAKDFGERVHRVDTPVGEREYKDPITGEIIQERFYLADRFDKSKTLDTDRIIVERIDSKGNFISSTLVQGEGLLEGRWGDMKLTKKAGELLTPPQEKPSAGAPDVKNSSETGSGSYDYMAVSSTLSRLGASPEYVKSLEPKKPRRRMPRLSEIWADVRRRNNP